MLALTRKTDDTIEIRHKGEKMIIWIDNVYNGRAKLGFEAPRSFKIQRGELVEDLLDDDVNRCECGRPVRGNDQTCGVCDD